MTLQTWMPRSLLIALIAAAAVLFALPQTCFACSCLPPGSPLEALADADAVFRGKVVALEQQTTGPRYVRATVRVTTVWKGAVTTETLIQTNSDSAACGFPFQQGQEYLIYAYTSVADDPNLRPVAPFATYLCSRTRTIGQAGDDLAALGPGQPPSPGLPNTGAGPSGTASESMIPGELLIGGAILAFLAVAQRGRVARE